MGLFDLFKKKPSTQTPPITDPDAYLILELKTKVEALGHQVALHPQYRSLIINSEWEIATAIIHDPSYHPSLIHLMVMAIHPTYFPNGIEENIVGVGDSIQAKVSSVLDNYISTTFLPIMEAFSESHDPSLDFLTNTNGKEILWHPKPGDFGLQGGWQGSSPSENMFLEMLKEKLQHKLIDQKFNWLKLYISRQPNGKILGECLLNNEQWEEGLQLLGEHAKQWPGDDFRGQKQFIMFRRCDKCD